MPELPEVETIRRSLAPRIEGRTIVSVELYREDMVVCPGAEEFRRLLTGRRYGSPGRRGKYLLLRLEGGLVLVVHFGMTGRLLWSPDRPERSRHTHVVWQLDAAGWLAYNDTRRFGHLWLVRGERPEEIPGLAGLGPEPLGEELTEAWLAGVLAGRKRPLKNLLLDQRLVAGIGNIYADEILHRAGLSPWRAGGTLSGAEIGRLTRAIPAVLGQGVADGGTTIRDYLDGRGEQGRHQQRLRVYGRQGQACSRCGAVLKKGRLGGRGTHYCPQCQL